MFQLQLQQLQRPGGMLVALVALASLATLAGSSPSLFTSPNALPASSSHGARAAASPASPNQNNWPGLGRRANVPIPDPASRVDLFIGTTSTGHAFPGEPPPPPLSLSLSLSLSLWLTTCGRFRFGC